MGLMQLLAAGRSLGRIADHPSRYKMMRQDLLPKFGPVKAPEERVPCAGGVSENPAIARTRLEQSSPRIAPATNDRKAMNAVEQNAHEVTVPGTVARPAFPLGRWTLFKNPFSKPPKPKAIETRAQPELSLDRVKPVRNDLSDTDLELIRPAKCASKQDGPATSPVALVTAAPERAAWDRIKTQFFGVSKS